MESLQLLAMINALTLEQWISTGGYIALFSVLLICGIGLPLPEDIPMLLAGAAAAHGKMDLGLAMIVGWSAIMGGDLILLHLARKFGRGVTKLPLVGRHINEDRLGQVEGLFDKYGMWVVAIGRLFAGVRSVVVVTAGTIKYHRGKFLLADGSAAMVSAGFFLLLGYWLGNNIAGLIREVEHYRELVLVAVAMLVIVAVGWLLWTRRGQKRALEAVNHDVAVAVDEATHKPPTSKPAKNSISTELL